MRFMDSAILLKSDAGMRSAASVANVGIHVICKCLIFAKMLQIFSVNERSQL